MACPWGPVSLLKALIASTLILLCILLSACSDKPSNYPHGKHSPKDNTYFTSFSEQPKTLDPAKSYSADEAIFTAQIYEPPLQYSYFKRPYELEPLTLTKMPEIKFYNIKDQQVTLDKVEQVAYTQYTMHIKPGIYYQPHPALEHRELIAKDYVLEIKRLAAPWNHSPIYGLMAKYIKGFKQFHDILTQNKQDQTSALLQNNISGVQVLDKYTYRITINGYYPQFLYWLAMPFFAPIPQEALKTELDWYPVGTGAYMLTKNDPNSEMILQKNPNYHDEYFPRPEGKDTEKFMKYTGKKLPLIDTYVFKLEKESIPRWHKFMQGYYDQSGVSAEQFEQAIVYDQYNQPQVTPELKAKNIQLQTDIEPSIFYLGFNMKDSVVGGNTKKARELRQAISIAVDYEEFISLFMNGRARLAQGPVPPGIMAEGRQALNPYVHNKTLADAKHLLAQAGYPNGINSKTNKPLVLNYAAVTGGGPESRAQFDWLRKQFAKLGIQLNVEATHYSRFQDKIRTGNIQLFFFGWNADYPDPENFLFLLYGPNSKMISGGENVTNYQNPDYDRLFVQLQKTVNLKKRAKIIDEMITIAQKDAPWVWGFHQQVFVLSHGWLSPRKLNSIGNNSLKYIAVEPEQRYDKQLLWNQSKWIYFLIGLSVLFLLILPAVIIHYRKERNAPKRY